MSFQKSSSTLKSEVLDVCGELTDGNSPFDTIALDKLNDLYQGLLSGGNEFGIDVGEPWVWAQAKNSIVFSLLASQTTGTVTLTQASQTGTFSSGPALSQTGRFLRVEGRADVYRIAAHTAASTTFYIDQPYIEASGTFNYKAFKLDYDLQDDSLVIDTTNNKIDFRENASSTLTATLTSGIYTPTTLCTEMKTRLEVAGDETYTVTFNSLTRKFTIAHGGAYLDLYFVSGTNSGVSTAELLGFDCDDYTGAVTYTSAVSLNGVTRLTQPIEMYREPSMIYSSSEDVGKIFGIDLLTYSRKYPLNRLQEDIPTQFCVSRQDVNGLTQVRFNASVPESVRVEAKFIPVTRKLVDNSVSSPKVPGSFSKYLVFGAAYYILLDKEDDKAEKYALLAKAKLQAMIADNRKTLSLAGQNFGKLVPRRGHLRTWNFTSR